MTLQFGQRIVFPTFLFFRLSHDLYDRRSPAPSDASPSYIVFEHPSPPVLLGRRGAEAADDDAAAVVVADAIHAEAAGAAVPRPHRLRLSRGLGAQDDCGDVPPAHVPVPKEMRECHR